MRRRQEPILAQVHALEERHAEPMIVARDRTHRTRDTHARTLALRSSTIRATVAENRPDVGSVLDDEIRDDVRSSAARGVDAGSMWVTIVPPSTIMGLLLPQLSCRIFVPCGEFMEHLHRIVRELHVEAAEYVDNRTTARPA